MHTMQSRRDFLAMLSAAGAAGVFGAGKPFADEAPPETTTIRLAKTTSICIAPGQIADALLRAEGFTDIRYLPYIPLDAVARGELDFGFESAAWLVSHVDAGDPVTVLAGVHAGCFELFAHERIRTVSDLKGRRVGIPQKLGSAGHLYLALMAAQVGLDPHKDINWVRSSGAKPMELFVEGKIDAFLAFHPNHRSCAPVRSVA